MRPKASAATGGALWGAALPPAEFDVVGVGEISLDHLCVLENPLQVGVDQSIQTRVCRPGGQIATALLGCARLGLRTAFIGSVGDDLDAEAALAPLRQAGIDLSSLRRHAGVPSRSAIILVAAESGERTVLAQRDRRLRIDPAGLRDHEIERGRVVHLDARDPDASEWAARVARRRGIPVVLDADRSWPGAAKLLSQVDFPIVSRCFAQELGGSDSVRDGLAALASHGARLSVVTLGERGLLARTARRSFEIPAYRVPVCDTTGAGDAFRSGFIWALLEGFDALNALHTASAAAALNCTALGAQAGLPDRTSLRLLLAEGKPLMDASALAG